MERQLDDEVFEIKCGDPNVKTSPRMMIMKMMIIVMMTMMMIMIVMTMIMLVIIMVMMNKLNVIDNGDNYSEYF